MGDAVPASFDDGEFPVAAPVPTDRGIDRSAGRIRMSLHHRVIPLVDGALLERSLEHRVRTFGQRHHHHPRGSGVKALDDALALMNARGADPKSRRSQAAEHGGAMPADTRMRRDSRRLIDGHDVVIGVQDGHVCHLDRRVLHRRRRFR